jgi:hypothetical protein
VCHDFALATPQASVDCDQLPHLDVKLLGFIHHPFVVAVAAQGIALVLLLEGWLLEWDYVTHDDNGPTLLEQSALQRGIPGGHTSAACAGGHPDTEFSLRTPDGLDIFRSLP